MRARLTMLVAATAGLVLIALSIPMALLLRNSAAESTLAAASESAETLTAIVVSSPKETVADAVQLANARGHYPISVFWPDGDVLGADAPRSAAVELAASGRSLTAATDHGQEMLFGVQGLDEGTAVIRAYVDDSQLTAGVARSWLLLGAVAAALFAFGLILASQLANRLLVPLRELAEVSNRLAGGDLDARAEADGPRELRRVGTALNTLAARIRDLLAAERERVADLSHRLRTPLTVLRLESEVLRDESERERVDQAVDEVERAVNAAIEDARNPAVHGGACDAAPVVAERVEFWSALAEDTDRDCRAELAPGPVAVGLVAEELSAAMDALLANVFAHTPDGTAFSVRLVAHHDGGALVEVADAGPGIPDASVLERGRSDGGSTGLGLDIARRAAIASGGTIGFGTGPGGVGAIIRLELGPPDRSTP